MTYYPNIPKSTDDPSVSQEQLRSNNSKINADFSQNHVALTSGSNKGFHTKIQFPAPLLDDPEVTKNQSVIYPKAPSANPELFFRNFSNIFQLTGLPIVNGTITDVIDGSNAKVTSEKHALLDDVEVTINNVVGNTGINNETFTITIVDDDNFELNAEVGGSYISGGTWTSATSTRFGFQTPWNWIINSGIVSSLKQNKIIQYSIPYPNGFIFFGGWLTPTTGLSQFGLLVPGTEKNISFSTTSETLFNYLIIGSS